MKCKFVVTLTVLALMVPLLPLAVAQEGPDGHTTYQLNMRAGPGTSHAVIVTLDANTGLVFEARSDDLGWLLGHTEDGAHRGWIASLYVIYREGFAAMRLPVSGEIVTAPAARPADAPPDDGSPENDPGGAPGSGPEGWPTYLLNMRAGPSVRTITLATLEPQTGLIFEARTADLSWLLAHTEDGARRGWVLALYLGFRSGYNAANLPVSDEVIDPAPGEGLATAAAGTAPVENPALASVLSDVPVIPSISARALGIIQRGGKPRNRYTKIGDCNSQDWNFMGPFDTGQYDLGEYGYLAPALSRYAGSHSRSSAAARVGFNALTMIDATWSDPEICQGGESSVWCELRTSQAAIAFVMFGANDVYNLSMDQFESSTRRIVDWSIQNGTLPVLTTLTWCGGGEFGDKALAMNVFLVDLAREYDLPVINFWRAAQSLPNCGLATDGVHLSTAGPPYGAYFTGQEAEFGFTLRSLVTLQTLDAIRLAGG